MNKALFLDRDGVINLDNEHVHKKEDFIFKDGIFELASEAQKQAFKVFVVTNQSGIARGLYTEKDFKTVTEWMESEFRSNGVEISKTYFCPHHPEFTGSCDCRKPAPGMLFRAAEEFSLSLGDCLMLGNKQSDMFAAQRAGIPKRWLLDEMNDEPTEGSTQVGVSLASFLQEFKTNGLNFSNV